jgi:cytochrome c
MGYVGGTIEVRLDGPEGELLGQTEIVAANPVFPAPTANSVQNAGGAKPKEAAKAAPKAAPKKAPASFNPFARPGIKLPIKSVNGVHDLYFVFKNEKAGPKDQLMSFSSINLSN